MPEEIPANLSVIVGGITGVDWDSRSRTARVGDQATFDSVEAVLTERGFTHVGNGVYRKGRQELTVLMQFDV